MNPLKLVTDLSSREATKVIQAACEIIQHSQEQAFMLPLIPFLDELKAKTKGLKLGGAFAPNSRFVTYALQIIEFHHAHQTCPCALYLGFYEGNNPQKEAEKGNVYIEETMLLENIWVDYYLLKCAKCGQKFKAFEREGHYMWWEWQTQP